MYVLYTVAPQLQLGTVPSQVQIGAGLNSAQARHKEERAKAVTAWLFGDIAAELLISVRRNSVVQASS